MFEPNLGIIVSEVVPSVQSVAVGKKIINLLGQHSE